MPPPDFLISLLARYSQQPPSIRPHITLTFAQSTDAKIAAIPGKQLILSGDESMQMTHWLRSMHDAILVGIGTALNDDPQLNSRHPPHRLCTLSTPLQRVTCLPIHHLTISLVQSS
jgi:2,5-diamino-6-(ribosylamino)-4(3H)-pyrimidinone 5'-phosphate reductase